MIGLYTDVHIPHPIIQGLRTAGIDVLTSQDDGARTLSDPALLDRVTGLGRILVTQDRGFTRLASERLQQERPFSGIALINKQAEIGQLVLDLQLIAACETAESMRNRIHFLPL